MAKLEKGINDLETFCIKNDRQDLLKEWDYIKNNGIKPADVCYGTSKKFWWIGECGHSYYASLNRRTANKTGCPYCCESHAKLLVGFNDLATTNPDLLSSWDYEKNGELLPSMVMKGQHLKVWWRGECGHSWHAAIYHRVQGKGCPICRKELKTSFPEQAIYYYVCKMFPDAENANISVLHGKELDIYIPSLNAGIEFDGKTWHLDKAKDEKKNQLCAAKKIHLYRIRDIECPSLQPNPYVHIIDFESYNDESLKKALKNLGKELDVNFEIDLEGERTTIFNNYIVKRRENSLAAKYPKLIKEWDYEKNGDLTPEMVTPMSGKKVWWKCDKGHEWASLIHARAKGSACPYCNGSRLLKGHNDLATKSPEILKNWNYEKNYIQPDEVTATSSRKVWWRCPTCGNDYLTSVRNKVMFPNSCPYCSHRIPIVDISDLKSNNPSLSKEWDYEKNGDLTPEMVTPMSGKKVWWKCDKGHSFQASIDNRSSGKGCPFCSGHKVLVGYNDFAHAHPELIQEWNTERNNCLPTSVTEHSGKKVWWKCDKGHEWQATVDSRSNGVGCPYCNGNAKKSVLNLDTNEVFKSLSAAAKACGLKNGDTISLCCQGKLKTAGGYRWKFI